MKNTTRKLFLMISLFVIASSAFAAGKTMYVSEKNVPVKANTSIFAKQIATLKYATPVEVISTKGNFTKIRSLNNSSVTGWVKTSVLTSKKLNNELVSTDATDISLAGKGNINSANPEIIAIDDLLKIEDSEDSKKSNKMLDAK